MVFINMTPKQDELAIVSEYGHSNQNILDIRSYFSEAYISRLIQSNEYYWIIDDYNEVIGNIQTNNASLGSLLLVKLELEKRVLGILYVNDKIDRKFKINDVSKLHFFAGYASIVLAGKAIVENEQIIIHRFKHLAAVTREVVTLFGEIPFRRRLRLIAQYANNVLNSECCSILLKKSPNTLQIVASHGYIDNVSDNNEFPIRTGKGTGLTGHIASLGQPFNGHGDDELVNHPAAKSAESRTPSGHCYSMIMLPLIEKHTSFGKKQYYWLASI